MYRVIKDEGRNENVYLQNTDTMGELNLGRVMPSIRRALEIDGYNMFDTEKADYIQCKDKWELAVSDSVKEELIKNAMPMKKPERKSKPKQPKQIVDVLDIIYGIHS